MRAERHYLHADVPISGVDISTLLLRNTAHPHVLEPEIAFPSDSFSQKKQFSYEDGRQVMLVL